MPCLVSGLVAARVVSETTVWLALFFATSGGCGGRDDHVDATDGTGRPRRCTQRTMDG